MGWGLVVASFVGALGRAAWRRRGEEEVGWLLGFSDPSALVVLFFVFSFLLVGFQFSFVALLLALGLPVFPWGLSRFFADMPEERG